MKNIPDIYWLGVFQYQDSNRTTDGSYTWISFIWLQPSALRLQSAPALLHALKTFLSLPSPLCHYVFFPLHVPSKWMSPCHRRSHLGTICKTHAQVCLEPAVPKGRLLPTQAATCTHPSCNKYSKVVRDAIVFSCPTWSTPDQVSQPRKFLPGLPHLEQIVNMCLTKIYNYKSSMYDTLLQLSPSNRDNSWGCCLSGTCAASQSSLRGLCNGQWIQGARFYQPDTDYIKDRHT